MRISRLTVTRLAAAFLLTVSLDAGALSPTPGAAPATAMKAQAAPRVIQSTDIGLISSLAKHKDRLKQLDVVQADQDSSYYVYTLKDEEPTYVVRVPATVDYAVQFRVLIENAVPYTVRDRTYLRQHAELFPPAPSTEPAAIAAFDNFGVFLAKHMFDLVFLGMMLTLLYLTFRMASSPKPKVISPKDLRGDLDDLVGMDDIKQEILHLQGMIENRELYGKHNLNEPFNVMLTGPAGTGKTKIVGYLAKRLGLPLIEVAASSLESGYVGGGSRMLNSIYKAACKRKRCIIFLDEAQTLFMPRGRSDAKWADDTSNTLLSLLDGVNRKHGKDVIWVVASNFDDATSEMDQAMLRRFAVKINFRLPNFVERKEILTRLIGSREHDVIDWDHLDIDAAASTTSNLSPAALAIIVDQASLIAIREQTKVTTDLLLRAFERTTIGLTDRATTANKEVQRRRVAIHELGHLFAQLDPIVRCASTLDEVKEKCSVLKISTESVSKIGALGFVLHAENDVPLRSLAELENDIIVLYAGLAAEELYYGSTGISMGAQNDIEKATRLLHAMVCRLSMYSPSKLDYTQLSQSSAETASLNKMEEKSKELYERAQQVVLSYRPLIDVFQERLLATYVLGKADIFDFLASCQETRAVMGHLFATEAA